MRKSVPNSFLIKFTGRFTNMSQLMFCMLSAFTCLRKARVSCVTSFRLSVRPSARNWSAPSERIFMKIFVGDFMTFPQSIHNLVTAWFSEERSSLIGTGFASYAFKQSPKTSECGLLRTEERNGESYMQVSYRQYFHAA